MGRYDATPSKLMGQNFLIDKTALKKIIEAAELTPKDTVLEVGPGIGTLTQELAKRADRVIAIEKDAAMVEILRETMQEYGNLEIIHDDILKNLEFSNFKLNSNAPAGSPSGSSKFQISNYKVVANIPYYLTSHLIRKFLEEKETPERIVLMIQKEVAQRICAKPPSPPHQSSKGTSGVGARMSILAVSVQFYAKPEIISYVKKECFWPSPKVDSAIIKITPKAEKGSIDAELFFKIVKAGFSHPRKQLAGNLSGTLKISKKEVQKWLLKNNIQPEQRAETLSLESWVKLVDSLGK